MRYETRSVKSNVESHPRSVKSNERYGTIDGEMSEDKRGQDIQDLLKATQGPQSSGRDWKIVH